MKKCRVWVIYKVKERKTPFSGIRLFLNIENFNTGKLSAWNMWARRASYFGTKLEAETAAIHFTTRFPEFIGRLFTTWTLRLMNSGGESHDWREGSSGAS